MADCVDSPRNNTVCHVFLSSFTVYRHKRRNGVLVCQKVLTHQTRFDVASSVNGKNSKKSMAHRVHLSFSYCSTLSRVLCAASFGFVSPYFSLKFLYRLPSTPQQNALGVSRPLMSSVFKGPRMPIK